MSTTDTETQLNGLPDFELSWAVDDADNPTHVTVFSEDQNEITTHWITIQKDYAIYLSDVA